MIINIDNQTQYKKLEISFINKDGDSEVLIHQIPKEYFYELEEINPKGKIPREDSSLLNWNSKRLYKNFDIKKFSNQRVFDYLQREFPKEERENIYGNNTPKKYFCDIETEIIPGYFNPSEPTGKVLTIALTTPENKIFLFGLKPLTKENIILITKKINEYFSKFNIVYTVKYTQFIDEEEMLYTFMNKVVSKCPFISGWNFVDFDWTYLINRCRILNININTALNCTGNQHPFIGTHDKDAILPKRKIIVDYLDIFKNYDTSLKMKRSMKLNNIGVDVLGLSKIHYNGTLTHLYDNDFLEFIYYNAVDAILVQLIDKKTNCWLVKQALSNLYKISVYKVERKVVCGDNLIQSAFWDLDQKVTTKNKNKSHSHEISGGYVKEPKSGYYEDIGVLDFSSLYPSIMRQFNVSPETYLGQYEDIKNKYKEDEIIHMKSDAVFKLERGVLPRLIDNIYSKRKEIQNESLELEQQLKEIKKYLNIKKNEG